MPTPPPIPADEVEQHRTAVTRYIRYLIRDAAEAEDLAQGTFLRAHRLRGTLRDAGALESWLYQIATHVSIDRMRQRGRLAERLVAEPADELPIPDPRRITTEGTQTTALIEFSPLPKRSGQERVTSNCDACH